MAHHPSSEQFADRVRRIVIDQSKRAGVGHIGSALSIADLLAVVIGEFADVRDGRDADRDRFILSKGHAALALYAALHVRGLLDAAELDTYCGDDTLLGVHPEADLPGVDFSTGSLGQGLPMAAGAALGARLQGSGRRIIALLSDAECNEGSVWEAAMFAAHHGLSNLIAIVDRNGQQALGYTDEVLSTRPLEERWAAFGWDVATAPGHDHAALLAALRRFDTREPGPPHVLVAETEFGHGVSFMSRRIEWHYLPMDDAQYAAASAELDAIEGRRG